MNGVNGLGIPELLGGRGLAVFPPGRGQWGCVQLGFLEAEQACLVSSSSQAGPCSYVQGGAHPLCSSANCKVPINRSADAAVYEVVRAVESGNLGASLAAVPSKRWRNVFPKCAFSLHCGYPRTVSL